LLYVAPRRWISDSRGLWLDADAETATYSADSQSTDDDTLVCRDQLMQTDSDAA